MRGSASPAASVATSRGSSFAFASLPAVAVFSPSPPSPYKRGRAVLSLGRRPTAHATTFSRLTTQLGLLAPPPPPPLARALHHLSHLPPTTTARQSSSRLNRRDDRPDADLNRGNDASARRHHASDHLARPARLPARRLVSARMCLAAQRQGLWLLLPFAPRPALTLCSFSLPAASLSSSMSTVRAPSFSASPTCVPPMP